MAVFELCEPCDTLVYTLLGMWIVGAIHFVFLIQHNILVLCSI